MQRKWWTLLVVCVATFMLLLDITIVNVALPDIERQLHASFSELQWVVDAYALMLAALLLTAGSLADLFGRRIVFATGLALFTLASLACGLAPTAVTLDLARGFQGIGGAVMFATSLALLAQEFEGRERGTAFGIWGATIGGAVAIGPLVGGAITSGFGWRWVFFINVPIGIAAIAVTFARLRESRDPNATRVDWLGLVTFSSALLMLVLALVRGNDEGWGSPLIVALLGGAAAMLAAFAAIEQRVAEPMLPLGLFRRRAFTGVQLAAFAVSASLFALFLYLTLYLQNFLGYSPIQTGLRFLPITLLSFVCAAISGKLSSFVPPRLLLAAGLALCAIGLFVLHGLATSSSWTALLPGFILMGAGVGTTNPALASTAIGVVPPRQAGMASGTNNTFRQVGIASGIAALGALFEHHIRTTLHVTGAELNYAASGHRPPRNVGLVVDRISPAFIGALNEIFVVGAVIAAVGSVLALTLVRRRDFAAASAPAQT